MKKLALKGDLNSTQVHLKSEVKAHLLRKKRIFDKIKTKYGKQIDSLAKGI